MTFTFSYETVALIMFASMGLLMLTGQRVFGAIGFVGAVAGAFLWGTGGTEMAFNASMSLMNWFPMITLPLFIFMGYILSESGIANDLYRMFHVWMGPLPGGLAIGTVVLMVAISAMNGLSVAGMAIGATIALPEMLRRGYDKRMVSGVIQAGSSLGLMMPPSVVLVLYGMIARQPVNKLWLAGVGPALLFAVLIIAYIVIRCRLNPSMGPALPAEERAMPRAEKFRLLLAGLLLCFACAGQKARAIGRAVFAFGLLFEGIADMGTAMEPLAQSPVFVHWLGRVRQHPWLGLLAGLGMTLTVQSSSATIALLQNFAARPGLDGSSLLGLAGALPVLLGDNIGTTITAVLASLSASRDAKRVAAAHAVFNLTGAAVFCAGLPLYVRLTAALSPKGPELAVIARQIAHAHTLFNVVCTLVWLPLTPLMVRFVCRLVPDRAVR